jgi:secernin
MCDTILAPPHSSAAGIMLFGKNSDRQRNEAQSIEYFHRADHAPDSQITCTYIAIPQVQHTHAVLLCRPFWIWGAEMGANEHGVVIGNEGLLARTPAPEEKALTGMDLLRLALERASTAVQAVEVMTMLLERYGQGGNCGHLTPNYYNNGFMVADTREAFVLETIGREWLVERVRGVHAISNVYSIDRGAHEVSAGLSRLIRDSGWSTDVEPRYATVLEDPRVQHIGTAGDRRAYSTSLLSSRDGRLSVTDMMSILREHGSLDHHSPEWRAECVIRRTLCMHAGAHDRPAQTVGSMVSEIHPKDAVHWVTGTAAPCTAIFKPILMNVPLPPHGPLPTDRFDPRTLWWRHERLHRAALLDNFAKFVADIRAERDALEADFHARMAAVVNGGSMTDRSNAVVGCWKDAMEMEDRWYAEINPKSSSEDTPYVSEWAKMNRLGGIDLC